MSSLEQDRSEDKPRDGERRKFIGGASGLAMAGALAGAYGTLAAYALRYVYPAKADEKRWMFVGVVSRIEDGAAIDYRTPTGAPVTVARQGVSGTAGDFIALSSVCPHLGCKVHWEPNRNRFFCPCHNGVFDPRGLGTSGPPKGQSLEQFPLRVVDGLLYIEAPVEVNTASAPRARSESRRTV